MALSEKRQFIESEADALSVSLATTYPIELSREFAKTRPHVQLLEVDDDHELAKSVPRIVEEATRFFRPYGVFGV